MGRGVEGVKMVKGYKLPVIRWINSGDIHYGNYSQYCIVYLKVAKRVNLKSSHHKGEMVIMWGDGSVN